MTAPAPKTPGWLDWCPEPSEPVFVLPPGTVDTHCHVFGPQAAFPFAPERKYTPCDASKDQLLALHDHLGVSRAVIVQATCHGADNRAMTDAVLASGGRARGIATVRPDVTDAELRRLDAAGVRGVRFNFLKRLVDSAPREDLTAVAERITPLGWHIVLYFEAADLPELADFFAALPTPLVVDHMGRPDVTRPVTGPEFSGFLRFVERADVWVKVTCPERLTVTGPAARKGERHPYADVVPFARRAVEEFPDRVLWGTDWPHPNLTGHMPDDGLLVDHIPRIAVTPELRHKLLVANPTRLYWPDERPPESGSRATSPRLD
ncbi:amidohydrolase family protein [Streptomyces sp. NPDC059477]|uniref:amidohydrolase family protein n=1 Tax=Streptomyces sp. NPDC059477 TaxID=3346847 RepID=UPI0036AE67DB